MTDTLIERLKKRTSDPRLVTDEGEEITRIAAPLATPEQVADTQKNLGFQMPAMLAQIYQEVGNGGFGPGYGLWGLPISGMHSDKPSVASLYLKLRRDKPSWPTGLLPLCDWGSTIGSYLDCSHPNAPIIRLDPNMPKEDVIVRVPARMQFDRAAAVKDACWLESASLERWLTDWVDGKRLFYLGYGTGDDETEDETEDEFEEEEEEE